MFFKFIHLQAAYDKLVNAKIAAKLREKEFDSKRKKFIDELVKREEEAMVKTRNRQEQLFQVIITLITYVILGFQT